MKLPELKIGTKIAKVPIVQGGMAIRLSTARLAAAVANEGGIGLIAISGMPMDEIRYEIRLARSLTKGVIGVNIMVAARNFADAVRTAMDEGIDLVPGSPATFSVWDARPVRRLSLSSLRSSWRKSPRSWVLRPSWSRARRPVATSAPVRPCAI